MAETTTKTTEMATIPLIEDGDLLIISKANGSATYKMSVSALATALLETMQFQNLTTTEKTIVGAINEIGGNV